MSSKGIKKKTEFGLTKQKSMKSNLSDKIVSRSILPECNKLIQYTNTFLSTGYRLNFTAKEALNSMFYCHNDTINQWSHLLSLIGAIVLYLITLFTDFRVKALSGYEKSIFCVYLFGCIFVFASSTILHIFDCGSVQLSNVLLKLDLTGIAVMIMTSFVPPLYFVFCEYAKIRTSYIVMIFTIGGTLISITWSPRDLLTEFRYLRTLIFVLMVTSGLVPTVHILIHVPSPHCWKIFFTLMAMFLTYGIGTLFYAFFIPERWSKSHKFDFLGHSHQWWHFFVTLGAFIHFKLILICIEYHLTFGPASQTI
ncbi:adiponectin receptor protein [Anaeramoeba flamelloides]|uniref:Adiponectin receptor protein n=1 Tax=Anaeramoeba flamelloides TaxID=1746091 RepID=A0ABQ8YEJ8_9EUKA|nr:adiponectin receptor protein [Anaeramoeba flamelloides]